MKDINEYILEKLRINDNTKLYKVSDYLFTVIYDRKVDLIEKLKKEYPKAYIESNHSKNDEPNMKDDDPNGFILPKDVAIELYKDQAGGNLTERNVWIFVIPERYTLETFRKDYESNEIDCTDLKEYTEHIDERLRINNDTKLVKGDDYMLLLYSLTGKQQMFTRIFDDVCAAQDFITEDDYVFWDGYVSKDLSILKKLQKMMNDDANFGNYERFVKDNELERYLSYVQRPEVRKLLDSKKK